MQMNVTRPRVVRVSIPILMLLSMLQPAAASDQARFRSAVDLSAEFLVRSQKATGLFEYDVVLRTGRPSGQNNIVRQVGTGFSLAEYLGSAQSPQVQATVRKLLSSLRRLSSTYGRRDRWLVTANGQLRTARTGATALALLTEILYYRASGDGQFEASRSAWLKGLLALRKRKGGFRKTPYQWAESPYFNGEAWLALAHYADTFDDQDVVQALSALDTYFVATYGRKPDVGFHHWGVMAAAIRHRTTGEERFVRFIEQQTDAYLRVLRPAVKPGANTCYALEGLATASALLSAHAPDSAILPPLLKRIEADTAKNLALQYVGAPGADGAQAGVRIGKLNPERHKGLFLAGTKQGIARIDHTQHCLSAFLKLHKPQQVPR